MAKRRFPALGATTIVAALAVLLALGPAGAGPLPTVDGRRPNVLLVTVDTLRADHLGAYGYGLPTSPQFDRLASEGVLFTDAVTPVPTTAPALASLLTGRLANEHGVRENMAELPDALTTIAETFAAAGYRTAAFYGNGAVEHLGRGFETFEPFADHWFFHDTVGTDKAIAWLEKAPEPWFLWVHFMDPHGPYNSSPPDRSSSFQYPDTEPMRARLPRVEQNYGFGVLPKYQQLPGHDRVVDYVRRYDGEIAGTDTEIGRLRDALERTGDLDHTLLVVTADHGESLGEDRYFFQHGKRLDEGSVRVPLLFRHPALPRGVRNETPATLIDLFPTIAALAAVPLPDQTRVTGRDLSLSVRTPSSDPEVVRVSHTVSGPQQTAVRRGRWILRGTSSPGRPPDEFARVELLDGSASPPRLVPAGRESEVRAELEPLLRAAARQAVEKPVAPRAHSEDEKARLRALGYID